MEKMYSSAHLPDHVNQEISDVCQEMLAVLEPIIKKRNTSISLAAFGLVHAAFISLIQVDDPEKKRELYKSAANALRNIGLAFDRM